MKGYDEMLSTSPSFVKDGDCFAIKLVAVAGNNDDWACYCGPAEWENQRIAENGEKVTEDQASRFAYLFCRRTYRK